MSSDKPQLNMVVAVGAGGNIGPRNGLPIFRDPEEGKEFRDWFMEMSAGGICIVGSHTFQMMMQTGWPGPDKDHPVAIWTRMMGLTPDKFFETLCRENKPMFLIGGEKTYQAFMPYVTHFFIRRAELIGPAGCHLPPLFGTTNRSH